MGSQYTEEELREIFTQFDTTSDGSIDITELGHCMRALGLSPTNKEIEDTMKCVDASEDGKMNFEEFSTVINNTEIPKITVEDLNECFKKFDKNKDGSLDREELREALVSLGECFTQDEVNEFFSDFDTDNDGKLDYGEFAAIILS